MHNTKTTVSQNLELESLEDEVWKELPNLDGVFLLSNYGRVKSINRTIQTSNNKMLTYRGRVYKHVLIKHYNHFTNDYTFEIKVGISYLGKNYSLRIARLVYDLFIERLTSKHKNLVVLTIDDNRYNLHSNNLKLQTISQKQYKMFHSLRCNPVYSFKTTDTYKKIALSRIRAVVKLDSSGNALKIYNSIKEASTENKLNSSGIIAAIKQRKMLYCGGFLWQYLNG